LPRFFIEKLSRKQQPVYDPYMGRGTTPIEAALLGRIPLGNDANPLCRMLVEPRLRPQFVGRVMGRLHALDFDLYDEILPQALIPLFHPATLDDLCCLRHHLLELTEEGYDEMDNWIRMLVISSLTGARSGYLIGPALQPNQPLLPTRLARFQAPDDCQLPKKSLFDCLRRKSELLTDGFDWTAQELLQPVISQAQFLTCPADHTPQIQTSSVSLVVTGPPELKPFDYARDNWIRCWFVDVDPELVPVSAHWDLDSWIEEMMRVFVELYRVLKPGGYCVVEIASLRPRKLRWDEVVLECALAAKFEAVAIIINTAFGGQGLLERPYMVRRSDFDEAIIVRKPGPSWLANPS